MSTTTTPPSNARPNPMLSALGKAGTGLSALGGLVTYFVTSVLITAIQGPAETAAGLDTQSMVAQVGGAVSGVLALLAGLAAAYGTVAVARQDTTPVRDPRNDLGVRLVPTTATGPVPPVVTDPTV